MPTKKTNERISKTLKKFRGRGNNHRFWYDRPALVARVIRVYEAYEKGEYLSAIAKREGIAFDTARIDVTRARELAVIALADSIESKRAEHIQKRVRVQKIALDDHDEAEIEHRAPFLRVITENQTGIEELDGLRQKDNEPPPAPVILLQFGNSEPQAVEELSDEQLLALDAQIEEAKGNLIEAKTISKDD